MTRGTAWIAVAALLAGGVSARAQELSGAPFAAALARVRAVRATAAPAPGDAPAEASYSGMAASFESAPAAGLDALAGDWLEVALAPSADEAARYDPKGFPDWLYRVAGLEVQKTDAYQVVWGAFGPAAPYAFQGFLMVEVPADAGASVRVAGHFEDDPAVCTNCSDDDPPESNWVPETLHEYRLAGDLLIDRRTRAGAVSFAGYRKK